DAQTVLRDAGLGVRRPARGAGIERHRPGPLLLLEHRLLIDVGEDAERPAAGLILRRQRGVADAELVPLIGRIVEGLRRKPGTAAGGGVGLLAVPAAVGREDFEGALEGKQPDANLLEVVLA